MYRNWFDADPERQNIILREIHAGEVVTLPENGSRLTAVPANHNRGVGAFNYVVETEDGAVIFLGTDTGFLKPEAWEFLERFRFDLVVLDCTAGLLDVPKTNGHMSAPQVIEVLRPAGFYWLLAGGIAYSVGAVLYGIGSKKPWFHSVFHIFVLLGSIFQAVAILLYIWQ